MAGLLLVLFMGWLISFLGQLPLGNLSITATQIGVNEGPKAAFRYAWGVMLIETIYLRTALTSMDWVYSHPDIFKAIGWGTVFLFFGLGLVNIFYSSKSQKDTPKGILKLKVNKFLLGISLSAVNPAQLPFWALWSGYMLDWKILHQVSMEYNLFTLGGGIGTMCGLYLYIKGGNYLFNKFQLSNKVLSYITGGIFIFAGLAQLWGMTFK